MIHATHTVPTGPDAILQLANQFQLTPPQHQIPSVTSDFRQIDSLRFMPLLLQTDTLNFQLSELSLLHQELTLRYDTFEFTDQEYMLSRLAKMKEICSSLKEFACKKGLILTKLQQPSLAANALRIHRDYHQDFIQLVQEIDTLKVDHTLIEWSKIGTMDLVEMEHVLKMIPSINAKFRRYLEAVNQLRSLISNQVSL
jgi:hypothetical protein